MGQRKSRVQSRGFFYARMGSGSRCEVFGVRCEVDRRQGTGKQGTGDRGQGTGNSFRCEVVAVALFSSVHAVVVRGR